MNPFIEKTIPLIAAFFLGIFTKKVKFLSKEDAPILLKFVLSVSLPALAIQAIYNVDIYLNMLLIPLLAMLVVMVMYGLGHLANVFFKMPKRTFGSFLIGVMIMNTAYALPFFHALFGDEGLARASLFDFGNSFMIFTFSYYNAIKYGGNEEKGKIEWKKFLRLPPLYAMAIAFIVKFSGYVFPPVVEDFLTLTGSPTVPLVMVALGLYFEPKLQNLGKAFAAIFIRMVLGLFAGWGISLLFGLEGLTATVVTVGASLPIGFNTLIFSDLEDLDREFAATMVSISMIIALFSLPILIYLFS